MYALLGFSVPPRSKYSSGKNKNSLVLSKFSLCTFLCALLHSSEMHTICCFGWLHHKQHKLNLKSSLQQSFLLLLAESTYDFVWIWSNTCNCLPFHIRSYWFGSCRDPRAKAGNAIYFLSLRFRAESWPSEPATDVWYSWGWGEVAEGATEVCLGPQAPCGWILITWKLFFPPTLLLQLAWMSPPPAF